MNFNINECNSNAFRNDDGSLAIIGSTTEKDVYVTSSVATQMNSSWSVSLITLKGEDLQNHIMYLYGGWNIDNCTVEINVNKIDGKVLDAVTTIINVTDHAVNRAYFNGIDPTETDGVLEDALLYSAGELGYILTQRMKNDCYEKFGDWFVKE